MTLRRILYSVLGLSFGSVLAVAGFACFSTRPYNFLLLFYARYEKARVTNDWSLNVGHGYAFPQLWNLKKAVKTTNRKSFAYSRLGDNQIRLLKVNCYIDGPVRHFECDLIHVTRETPEMKYLAISYTWGDPKIVYKIPCGDDGMVGVTQSMVSVLEAVVAPGHPLYLWVDALCINQADDEERSRQVRFMDQVYANAYQVVVCLGEPDSDSDRAMDALYPLERAYRLSAQPNFRSPELCPSLLALGILLRRPWFTRIWVIQEIAVASSVVFICGDRLVHLKDLFIVLVQIAAWGHEALIQGLDLKAANYGAFFRSPEGYMNGVRMAEIMLLTRQCKPPSFPEALMSVGHFSSTDPRDKIYALLGFTKLPLEEKDKTFRPNYDKSNSAQSLYTNTARYLLDSDPSMSILHRAGMGNPRSKYLKDLPSWVPDWSTVNKETKNFGSGNSSGFCAGGPPAHKARILNSKFLMMDGMSIDIVMDLSSVRPSPPNYGRLTNFTREQLVREYKKNSLAWLREAEDMVTSLCNAKCPSSWKSSDEKSYPTKKASSPETWSRAFTLTMVSGARDLNAGGTEDINIALWSSMVALYQVGDSIPIMNGKATNYNATCTDTTTGRRFLTTQKGFIGLTSQCTEVGDTVCLFPGTITPFVLRKGQRTWTLVGEAYIHGLMDGEGMEKDKLERFIVR